jgi:uncharacterized membrane protein YeiH
MDNLDLPLSPTILGMNYLGDVVFAVSGALTAGRHKMDIVGYVLIGTITGIGGGTLRDLLLGRKVWWISNPDELILCVVASIIAFFFIKLKNNHRSVVWLDAIGLGAFAVVGCHIALIFGAPFVVAVFMGMLTATGGGVIRDVLTNTKPMILSAGQLYATAALGGSFVYALMITQQASPLLAQALGFLTVLALRTASIVYGIGTGTSGDLLSREKPKSD